MTPGATCIAGVDFAAPSHEVAAQLIGVTLLVDGVGGRIVECEAYDQTDPASHTFGGPTARNAAMFGPPGHAYVYLNYGIHYLVNAVTESEGWPAAVLIRALEPVDGLPLMRRRRGKPADVDVNDLCRGPGNLTKALGIDLRQNLRDLTDSPLRVEDRGAGPRPIAWSRRIGINVGVEQEWRVTAIDSAAVSGPRRVTLPARAVRPAGGRTRSRR